MEKLTISDIPVISARNQDNFLELALRIKANGEDAKIFISSKEEIPFSGDDKIVIVWDSPNLEFGESFTTKYYEIREPGVLQWGHDDGVILIEKP
jgi:hypothetical protein